MLSGDRRVKNILKDLRNYSTAKESVEQKTYLDPLEILKRHRFGVRRTQKDEEQSQFSLPDIKKAIVKALMYSTGGKPLNLVEIVDFVRRYNSFICPSSVDEAIYNGLYELCSEKVVHRVCNDQ